jgi:hypothetical protein
MAYVLDIVTDVLQQPSEGEADLLLMTVLEVLAESFKHDEDGTSQRGPHLIRDLTWA